MPILRKHWQRLVLLLSASLCMHSALAVDQVAVPALRSPITDLTNTLTAEQINTLDTTLRAFETRKGSQFAILIVPTTQPETIEQFSIRVVDAWKLGRKNVDDGVLLLVAKDDHAMRIEVGRGLEGVLTDATTNRIIRNIIRPHFRSNEYFAGIDEATTRIIQVIDGEVLPEPPDTSSGQGDRHGGKLPWPLLIIAVVVGGSVLRSIFGRLGAASVTSIGVGILLWFFVGSFIASIIAGIFAFIFVVAGGGGRGGWMGPGGGGWSSGGGFGGGGGGGWSGGGGGFSGGGSSGSW